MPPAFQDIKVSTNREFSRYRDQSQILGLHSLVGYSKTVSGRNLGGPHPNMLAIPSPYNKDGEPTFYNADPHWLFWEVNILHKIGYVQTRGQFQKSTLPQVEGQHSNIRAIFVQMSTSEEVCKYPSSLVGLKSTRHINTGSISRFH